MKKLSKVLGLAVAVPAVLVALAVPSGAATPHVVAFSGRIDVKPTTFPQMQELTACFGTIECGSTVPAGVAAGAGASADAITALAVRAQYSETCTLGTFAPTGSAQLTGNVHKALGGWSPDIQASWFRAGLVAVISGEAVGAALFTPVQTAPNACDVAVPVVVTGAVEVPA